MMSSITLPVRVFLASNAAATISIFGLEVSAWSTGTYDTPSVLGLSEINGLSPFTLLASR
jgi:hypothetical protein